MTDTVERIRLAVAEAPSLHKSSTILVAAIARAFDAVGSQGAAHQLALALAARGEDLADALIENTPLNALVEATRLYDMEFPADEPEEVT